MASPISTTQRLSALRMLLSKADRWGGVIHALIVPSEDAHQSEYVATAFERRAFISGFNGSFGMSVTTVWIVALNCYAEHIMYSPSVYLVKM